MLTLNFSKMTKQSGLQCRRSQTVFLMGPIRSQTVQGAKTHSYRLLQMVSLKAKDVILPFVVSDFHIGVQNSVSKQKNGAHRQNNGKCSVCVYGEAFQAPAVCAETLSLSQAISDSGSYLHKELSVTLPVLKS